MYQHNTKEGAIVRLANADLTGMEGRLVCLVNASGVAKVALPAATDCPRFILTAGGIAGANVTIAPLEPNKQVRVVLKGTCNPGDDLCVADPSTAADAGKVRTQSGHTGTYKVLVAEEVGVDGQYVLARPPMGEYVSA